MILTGILAVILLILNAGIGPVFSWQRVAILPALVLLLVEAWMVWYTEKSFISKASTSSGWTLAAVHLIISINFGYDIQKSTSQMLNGSGLFV